jgi:serine/threonine-protein kinase RsbW
VTLRLMTPDDAVAVARCTYACYGYTVPDDYLYFPDHMREMLHGGLLEVCVGATAEGEIVGCLTREVDRRGAAVGYLGEGMVEPRFRGHRLLEQMLAFFVQRATEQRMLGLYAEAVTVHPFSQKSNIALGAAETGVQLADEAPVVFKQIADSASKKRTATVLNYFRTNQGSRRTVYSPAHHRAMVERIYERSGLERTVETATASAASPPLPQAAQVRVDVFPGWSEAALRVTAYGRDLPDLVRLRLRELCLRRIDWISLDLPLSHPGARDLCAPLEALGFFFAGVIPELADDDVLRLQYLNDVDADVESAQIASDFGKELFAYVVGAMRGQSGGT